VVDTVLSPSQAIIHERLSAALAIVGLAKDAASDGVLPRARYNEEHRGCLLTPRPLIAHGHDILHGIANSFRILAEISFNKSFKQALLFVPFHALSEEDLRRFGR
jgi:hypothetical protein